MPRRDRECVFCAIAAGEHAADLVHEDERVLAILDHAPLIKGHVLVMPRSHIETLDDLPHDLIEPVFELVRRTSRAFPRVLGSDGSYAGINTRVSQSVPHFHVHVVPRKQGDGLFRAGLVWVRRRYAAGEAAQLAARLREAIAAS